MTEPLSRLQGGLVEHYRIERELGQVEAARDAHRTALACLGESIAPETVDAFRGDKDRTFICLEAALDTTKKWNLKHHLGDR